MRTEAQSFLIRRREAVVPLVLVSSSLLVLVSSLLFIEDVMPPELVVPEVVLLDIVPELVRPVVVPDVLLLVLFRFDGLAPVVVALPAMPVRDELVVLVVPVPDIVPVLLVSLLVL